MYIRTTCNKKYFFNYWFSLKEGDGLSIHIRTTSNSEVNKT